MILRGKGGAGTSSSLLEQALWEGFLKEVASQALWLCFRACGLLGGCSSSGVAIGSGGNRLAGPGLL